MKFKPRKALLKSAVKIDTFKTGAVLTVLFSSMLVIVCGCKTSENYITSSGEKFTPKAYYPEWSWDTVQEFKMFGDNHVLTDEERKIIAPLSNFICIEKQHGRTDLGAADLGLRHEASRFKALNPKIKVLGYFNGAIAYEFTTYTKKLHGELVTEQDKKDLLLFDSKKNEYPIIQGKHRHGYDILKPTMRKWWSETVGKLVNENSADGVFWDQMHGFAWLRPDKKEEIISAHVELQQLAKMAMGKDKILLCNNAAHNVDFIKNSDAVMYEHFKYDEHYRENLQGYVNDWERMKQVAELGKINVFRMPLDLSGTKYGSRRMRLDKKNHDAIAKIAKERIEFPLACFLIGAQPYSYFMLSWGWGTYTGALVEFPEMKKRLGPPQGDYKRESEDKWIFTRKFKYADVWIDLEKEKGEITWK